MPWIVIHGDLLLQVTDRHFIIGGFQPLLTSLSRSTLPSNKAVDIHLIPPCLSAHNTLSTHMRHVPCT